MIARIGFPSSHVAYRQLVPNGNEALPTDDFAVRLRGMAVRIIEVSSYR
jgi:hypothetical protein